MLISVDKDFCIFRARFGFQVFKTCLYNPKISPAQKKYLLGYQKLKLMLVFKNIENFAMKFLQN
jgi:hypothetical protein